MPTCPLPATTPVPAGPPATIPNGTALCLSSSRAGGGRIVAARPSTWRRAIASRHLGADSLGRASAATEEERHPDPHLRRRWPAPDRGGPWLSERPAAHQ